MREQVNEIEQNLRHFTGTEMYYYIPILRTRFTDGLKYLANAADCYWLITDASVIAKSLNNRSRWVTIDFKRLSEDKQATKLKSFTAMVMTIFWKHTATTPPIFHSMNCVCFLSMIR